jgi:hypothetical protein
MSSSRSRDASAVGVGLLEERVKRIFPPALMKSSRSFGVKFGPRPARYQSAAHPNVRFCSTF